MKKAVWELIRNKFDMSFELNNLIFLIAKCFDFIVLAPGAYRASQSGLSL